MCHIGTKTTLKLLFNSLDYQHSVINFYSWDIMARTYSNTEVCCWWRESNTITCTAYFDRVPWVKEHMGTSWWSLHWLQNCPFLLHSWISIMWLTSCVQAGVAERYINGWSDCCFTQRRTNDFIDTTNNQTVNYNPPTPIRPFKLLYRIQQSCWSIYLLTFSITTQCVTKQQVKNT